jgi:hypothetical protein
MISRRNFNLAAVSSLLLPSSGLILPKPVNAFRKGSAFKVYFNTAGMTIGGGKMGYATLLGNGNLLYVCMRHPTKQSKVGFAEVNPTTRAEIVTFNDPNWASIGGEFAGPEIVTKQSNGNYIVAPVDGMRADYTGSYPYIAYEIQPNATLVWGWAGSATAAFGVGSNLVKNFTIGGTDIVGVFGCGTTFRRGAEFIKRSDRSTVFHIELSPSDEVNSGAFRNVGGVNYVVAIVWTNDPLAYLINYDTQTIAKTVNLNAIIGGGGSGWDINWIDDDTWNIAAGFASKTAVVKGVANWIAGTGSLSLNYQSATFPIDFPGNSPGTPVTSFNAINSDLALATNRSGVASPGIVFQLMY